MRRRTLVEIVASVAALAAAAFLAVLVHDVRSVQHTLVNDDGRFEGGAVASSLWDVSTALPASWTMTLLGVQDDLRYRRTVLGFLASQPAAAFLRPGIDRMRAEAQQQLLAIGRDDSNRVRRSEALNLLGVLAFPNGGSAPLDAVQRQQQLSTAIGLFQESVTIDPSNADAKTNLELALRDEGATQLPGNAPTGSPSGGAGVGKGGGGGGY